MSKYNILWIDDEWESMTSFMKYCSLQYQMELHPFKTQTEGLDEYAKCPSFWDAAILDAKVLDKNLHEAPNVANLQKAVLRIKEEFNDLQYFISTGQPDLLSDSMFKAIFPVYYEKATDDEKLCQDIIKAIKESGNHVQLLSKNFAGDVSYGQLAGYLDDLGLPEGWMAIFDEDKSKPWDEKLYRRDVEFDGKTLHIVGL